jgi:hypothetical protein
METSTVLVRFHLISLLSTSIFHSEVVVIKHPIFATYVYQFATSLSATMAWLSGARDSPLHTKRDDMIDLKLAICSIDYIHFYM